MSTLELFLYIMLAVVAQLGLFAGVAFFRHWRTYIDVKRRLEDFGSDAHSTPAGPVPGVPDGDSDGTWSGYRDFKVVRKVFEDPSHSVCSFYLKPVDGGTVPGFKPGQFLTFRLDVRDPATGAPSQIVRCYSLSARPGLDQYRISVKRAVAPADSPDAPPGLSSNHLHDNVNEGDVLAARAPGGHFFLGTGETPVALIAGGIGITPIVSMLDTLLAQNSSRQIYVFYGVRNGGEHALKAHLEKQAREHDNVHLHVCYSQPHTGDTLGVDFQHKGRVDISLLRMTLPLMVHHFYICGPKGMMETLVPALRDWGVHDSHIHYEAFGPASVPNISAPQSQTQTLPPQSDAHAKTHDNEAAAAPISVSFTQSGKTLMWSSRETSILDLAEANAIRVDSGCRAGACGACETAIEDGEVVYDTPPDFEPQAGHCLLCVSRPVRDVKLKA